MRKNELKKTIAAGGRALTGWLSIPNAYSAEIMAHLGWDALTIDIQHGVVDYAAAVGMMQAISTTNTVPMARVPWNDPAIIMKMLDAGAYGIICPMINNKAEPKRSSYGRYPPIGTRSMGPTVRYSTQAQTTGRAPTRSAAVRDDRDRDGLKNLDGILSVKGLAVSMSDRRTSMAHGKPPTLDPSDPEIVEAIKHIAKKTNEKGLIAGVHTDGPKTALMRFDQGYHYCAVLNDARMLATAAAQAIKDIRGGGKVEQAKTY